MSELSDFDIILLKQCAAGDDIKSSDRREDRSRTKLKKRGYLRFERSYWKWMITPEGHALLLSLDRAENGY